MVEIAELKALLPEQIVEAANGVLAREVGVDDPAFAARRLAELAQCDVTKAGELEALARDAAKSSPDLLAELLTSALNDLASSKPSTSEIIRQAASEAGDKEFVVGVETFAFGYLLLCAYLAIKTGGVKSDETTVKITEQKDGRREVTIGHSKRYINPLTAVGSLLGALWPKGK